MMAYINLDVKQLVVELKFGDKLGSNIIYTGPPLIIEKQFSDEEMDDIIVKNMKIQGQYC